MNILAFETATPSGGVALMRGERLCAVAAINAARQHSGQCLDLATRLLASEGIGFADVDAFAAGRGPGSFTGVRIAMTIAKTLAWAGGKKLVGVCSMQAMAANALSGEECDAVLVLLDARRGEFYGALYEGGAEGWRQTLVAPFCCPPERLQDHLSGHLDRRIVACGEGAMLPGFRGWADAMENFRPARADRRFANPATVALLGRDMALAGEFMSPETAAPIYLREPLERP